MTAAPTNTTSPREFGTARSLLYATILVLTFFALLEGALRLLGFGAKTTVRPRLIVRSIDTDITLPFMRIDAELFWSPQPGFRGELMGKPVTINALGLRGAEVSVPRPRARRRLAAFGDSITFGYGVGDAETYAYLLNQSLAARGVECVNAGVTGYTSHQVLRYLRRLAATLELDAATVCIGWNDSNRRPADDREYERRLAATTSYETALDQLRLYRVLKALLLRPPPGAPEARTERVPLPQYRENLMAIAAECRQRRIRLAFLALPHRKKSGAARATTPYADLLARVAAEQGVPLIEMGDLGLATALDSNEAMYVDSLHFSPQGHAYLAQRLAPQLIAARIVD
ncbi:MAG: SGNH/GDSL hydrolase family protein [Vicinamibacteria bacterium]|nr:SGNH/GDSL hydrolase family protein [Vicinamibacteria bacterium]